MTQKRPQQFHHSLGETRCNKRRTIEPNQTKHLPESNTSSIYGTSSIASLGSYGDTEMCSPERLQLDVWPTGCASASQSNSQALASEPVTHGTHHKQDICFGMICDVETQLLSNLSNPRDANFTNGPKDDAHFQLKIIFRNKLFLLQSPKGSEIGILNTAISRCFQELLGCISVHYQAYVASNVWRGVIESWKQTGRGRIFPIDINVYGSYDDTTAVGKVFSKARLYFQHPYHFDNRTKYENPHYINFSTTARPDSPSPMPCGTSIYAAKSPSTHNISEVFQNLNQQEHIRQAEIDTRVKTPLLCHQKEGVYFIMEREAGIIPPALSLWKLKQTIANRPFYEHLITGSKRQVMPEINLGGIIADEMGMGKSLTILSTIVGTLQYAEIFAQSGENDTTAKSMQKVTTKTTLILVPSAMVLDGWIEEVETHIFPNTLKVHKYHGHKRELDLRKLLEFDVIITTYATVATEFRTSSNVLHRINWFRIVLDEAHAIRHEYTSQFRAVSTLSSKIRWCVTGTPIQNSLKDLAALIKFLRVPQLETALAFQKYITLPIESGISSGFLCLRLLLRSLCLRRTNELLQLSEPATTTYRLDLIDAENATYKAIGETYRQEIDRAVSGQKTAEVYNGILQALLRLRLLCNHGTYEPVPGILGGSLSSDSQEALELLQQSDNANCAYCSCDVSVDGKTDDSQLAKFTVCNHLLCSECLPQYEIDLNKTRLEKKAQCPLCGSMITGSFLVSKEEKSSGNLSQSTDSPAPLSHPRLNRGYSTKLSALLQDIESQKELDKSIIFSAWKKSLDVVARLFSSKNIPFAIINGSLSLPERRRVLSNFKSKPDFKVLLMTLGTGAVGLNLTVANRIHILEPQWNPSIEKQAIGRILRLGQEQKITIIRYITNNTVEEYVESRQTRKLHLASLGWEQKGDNEEDQKLKELLELRSLVLRTEA